MISDILKLYYEHFAAVLLSGIVSGGLTGVWAAAMDNPPVELPLSGGSLLMERIHRYLFYVLPGMALGGCVFGTLPFTLPCVAIYLWLNIPKRRSR